MLLTPWGNAQAPLNQIPLLLLLTPLPTILHPTSILFPISTLHIHDFLSLIIYLFIPILPISSLPISLLFLFLATLLLSGLRIMLFLLLILLLFTPLPTISNPIPLLLYIPRIHDLLSILISLFLSMSHFSLSFLILFLLLYSVALTFLTLSILFFITILILLAGKYVA